MAFSITSKGQAIGNATGSGDVNTTGAACAEVPAVDEQKAHLDTYGFGFDYSKDKPDTTANGVAVVKYYEDLVLIRTQSFSLDSYADLQTDYARWAAAVTISAPAAKNLEIKVNGHWANDVIVLTNNAHFRCENNGQCRINVTGLTISNTWSCL